MSSPTRWFILLITLVVVGFVVGSLVREFRAERSDALAMDITVNAIPSVGWLATSRNEMRQIERDLWIAAHGAAPIDRSAIDAHRRLLGEALEQYGRFTTFRGERALYDALMRQKLRVERDIDSVVTSLAPDGSRDGTTAALVTLGTDVDAFYAVGQQLIDLNLETARQRADAIRSARQQIASTTYFVDASVTVLALLALVFAVAYARRQSMLAAAHERAIEERAHEFERFASRVAHDIKGPLTTVALSIDMASESHAHDRNTSEAALERAKRGVTRTVDLVNGLLAFARAGAGPERGAQTEVDAVVDEIVRELTPVASAQGVRLDASLNARGYVPCNRGVLVSMVSNLVGNAIKYIGSADPKRVTIRLTSQAGRARVEVEDTGPGIPSDLGARAFEPYVRGANVTSPGLGLGLATVKLLAERHGGAVGCSAVEPHGALVWFELPFSPVPFEHARSAVISVRPPAMSKQATAR